jgi:hypothetical protein
MDDCRMLLLSILYQLVRWLHGTAEELLIPAVDDHLPWFIRLRLFKQRYRAGQFVVRVGLIRQLFARHAPGGEQLALVGSNICLSLAGRSIPTVIRSDFRREGYAV